MAGMARVSSAKMKGLEAMAIAWAAFCIPTSITTVRRCAGVFPASRESIPAQPIAASINTLTHVPSRPMCARIVR